MENLQQPNLAQTIYRRSQEKPLTVTQAMNLLKPTLEQLHLCIIGEVSQISANPAYKAVYFTLRDAKSALPCLIWRDAYRRCGIELKVGEKYQLDGNFSLYAAKGQMQFSVGGIQPAGEGILRAQVAALAKRLEAEGLFQRQKQLQLPQIPARIGVVTSPSGKAIHDVLRTLRRRWPAAVVLFAGVRVEGKGADQELIAGLQRLAEGDGDLPEVILLVRGGGSYEDLMPFNSEALARAIAALPIPVITGIGHEPDTSIADMTACKRASTPTGAAEAAVPNAADLRLRLAQLRESLYRRSLAQLDERKTTLRTAQGRLALHNPRTQIRSQIQELAHNSVRIDNAWHRLAERESLRFKANQVQLQANIEGLLHDHVETLQRQAQTLEALSPLAVLGRGFAMATKSGRVLKDSAQIRIGDRVQLRLAHGSLDTEVKGVKDGHDERR
ncbi:MAG: exodeoxyribonuclease VII large subunit [Coriobacteriales bacterium]|jgi:exodeoxyribonuclease VII large subunit|nr:exodeoxyribonuclease VII large subunit [Coriobacteriales bacterium]